MVIEPKGYLVMLIFLIPNFNGESMLLMLDMDNICASSGSMYNSGKYRTISCFKSFLNIDKKLSLLSALRFSLELKY